jgi:hypothetical protein
VYRTVCVMFRCPRYCWIDRVYVDGPLKLGASYKGKALKARVRRDGVIFFAGKKFASPSTAALYALPTRRAINGWWFWKYERAPGDWVRLRELRK